MEGSLKRLQENTGAANVKLSAEEVQAINDALDRIEMSEAFGGSRIVKNTADRAE